MTNSTIQPKILKGTRDFLPQDMAKREYVMNTVRTVFKQLGYDTIETPVIEYAETLLGKYGEEGSKLVYKFKDNGGRDIALRYDQTVPTARYVAMYQNELPMPFKRYQISRVWRADKPAKGRYREFYQCDIDIIGTDTLLADAEIAYCIERVYTALKFPQFVIRVNSRALMNDVLQKVGVAEEQTIKVIQAIDKYDKVGAEGVEKILTTFLDTEVVMGIIKFVTTTGTTQEKLQALSDYNIDELKQFFSYAKQFGVSDTVLQFDPSLARGLDYYTGVIFEVVIPELQLGSVCGGGRYDDLCGMFGRDNLSGVGVAFGFDRTIVAMEELGLLNDLALSSQVMVANFDTEFIPYALEVLTTIQAAGVNAEIYFEPAKLVKQFKYANKKQIPYVVICGSDEVSNSEVAIKNMATGKQKTIPKEQLSNYFTGLTALQ